MKVRKSPNSTSGRSLLKTKNKKGPRTDTWGIPADGFPTTD